MKVRILFILIVFLIGGCATRGEYIGKHAIVDPAKGISITHPIQIEKAGIKTIVTFQGLMDPGLWVEVVNAGGVWPFLAQTPSGKILDGYVHLFGLTYWGDWQLQFVFIGEYEEIKDAKINYLNRDDGFAYKLNGKQVEYDAKKFDKNEEYRDKFFQENGMMISEQDVFWKNYFIEKGLNVPENFTSMLEISIPSPEWEEYKDKLAKVMRYNYKMSNGEIRCGNLPLKSFRQTAVEMPGFNGVDRYLKRAKVPLIALPFSGVGLLASTGVILASDAIVAGVNSDLTGSYARAKTLRYQMAPLFRQICLIYKELLEKRDERINKLEFRLELLQK